jgi:AcrR family transcriptional regulator
MQDHGNIEKQDKREHLLEVAERLFAQNGYEAVSIRDLATEAGVNVAMVSYYFQSKDNLFKTLLENRMPKTRVILEELLASDISSWEKLSKVIDMYIDKFFSGRAFHRIIMRELSLQQRPEHVKLIAENMGRNMQIMRAMIEEGQEKGQFRYVDSELTISSIFGTLSTAINNQPLMCILMKEPDAEQVYGEVYRERFRKHIKSMLQAHLLVPGRS